MDDLACLREEQHSLLRLRHEGGDHIITGSQLDPLLDTVGKLIHVEPEQFAFEGDKAEKVLFQAECCIERLVRFLQRALSEIVVPQDRLSHRCHRFLHAAAAADLQEEFSERQL